MACRLLCEGRQQKRQTKSMKTVTKLQGWRSRILLWGVIATAPLFAVIFAASSPPTTDAVSTVPTKKKFQGLLANAAANIMPNGTYNMRFKIYDAPSNRTLQWSEDRLVAPAQGVTVTNA